MQSKLKISFNLSVWRKVFYAGTVAYTIKNMTNKKSLLLHTTQTESITMFLFTVRNNAYLAVRELTADFLSFRASWSWPI